MFLDVAMIQTAMMSVDWECRVSGVTQMESKFYVVCFYKSTIFIYDDTFGDRKQFEVIGMEDPEDMVACKRCRCLYIVDDSYKGNLLWRVNVSVKGYQVDKFLESVRINTLSVSPDGRLMFLSRWNDLLLIYGPDGRKLAKWDLSKYGFENSLHAVASPSGGFILCQSHGSQHQICRVDANFALQETYGGTPGDDPGHLDSPSYLAVDPQNGRVFVADRDNRRVLVLDPQLRRYEGLIQIPSHERPWRLSYDNDTEILLVITADNIHQVLTPKRVIAFRVNGLK